MAIARRHGEEWYVGAMTDWTDREIEIDLSFLGGGSWNATIFEDGVNASRSATDYRHLERRVTSEERFTVRLAPGGGWVGRFER